jgi:hypothetical protein
MKLARITKPLRSVQVRVMLAGDLNASLERYAKYYEQVHGEPVDTRALIPEILRAFLDADREFQSWSRSDATKQPRHDATPSSHNGSAKTHRDFHHRGTG